VSDDEIARVVDFLKKESEPDYDYKITEGGKGTGDSGGVSIDSGDADELLEDAINIAIEAGRVSTSYLQRRMKIGYSRAARFVDLMEEIGVVSAGDGAKPREVLVTEWPPAGVGVNTDLEGKQMTRDVGVDAPVDPSDDDDDADEEIDDEESDDEVVDVVVVDGDDEDETSKG
jgi:hypothetical protein